MREILTSDRGPHILPALLQCDFARLGEVAAEAEAAGARILALDVMDGHFVPNLTYGPPVIRCLRRATRLALDGHLMIANPARYVEEYPSAGCDSIIIHVEAVADPRPVLEHIRRVGAVVGLALNPPTPLDRITPYLDAVDLVLVMSVDPGFGGQGFQAQVLDKVRWLRRHGPRGLWVEVDGGLNAETIPAAAGAGANLLVVGSALFGAPDFRAEFHRLQTLARQSALASL